MENKFHSLFFNNCGVEVFLSCGGEVQMYNRHRETQRERERSRSFHDSLLLRRVGMGCLCKGRILDSRLLSENFGLEDLDKNHREREREREVGVV